MKGYQGTNSTTEPGIIQYHQFNSIAYAGIKFNFKRKFSHFFVKVLLSKHQWWIQNGGYFLFLLLR